MKKFMKNSANQFQKRASLAIKGLSERRFMVGYKKFHPP
ncbi:hypothetical protein DDI_3237 [Dickeya dianthicola RNS04.9]|nr:hypothetical protein DDI_3237 [Dickeya dianthicola RNS04.9]